MSSHHDHNHNHEALISSTFTNRTRRILNGGEQISFGLHYGTGEQTVRKMGRQITLEKTWVGAYEKFIHSVFNFLDPIIDLDFQQNHNEFESDLIFHRVSHATGWGDGHAGSAMFDDRQNIWNIVFRDDFGIREAEGTIRHELGHALGLQHPHNNGTHADWGYDDSVMSYNDPGEWVWPEMLFTEHDIEALIDIWGAEDDNVTIESAGNTTLLHDWDGNGLILDELGNYQYLRQVEDDWRIADQDFGYDLVGAEHFNHENHVAWSGDNRLQVWEVNENWEYGEPSRDSETHNERTLGYFTAELQFNQDFDGDGQVGLSTIETVGSVDLLSDGRGLGYVQTGQRLHHLQWRNGAHVGNETWEGWTARAAESFGLGNNRVAWTHEDGRMTVWDTGADWRRDRQTWHQQDSKSYFETERAFGVDLNNDNLIGLALTEGQGDTSLFKDGRGRAYVEGDDGFFQVMRGNRHRGDRSYTDWTAIGAETVDGVNQVAWKNSNDRFIIWTMDADWNYESSRGFSNGSLNQVATEIDFNQDLNDDGVIGMRLSIPGNREQLPFGTPKLPF